MCLLCNQTVLQGWLHTCINKGIGPKTEQVLIALPSNIVWVCTSINIIYVLTCLYLIPRGTTALIIEPAVKNVVHGPAPVATHNSEAQSGRT